MLKLEKTSNILSIILFSALILSSISGLLGQIFPNLMTSGFFAYVLNLFASPITMFFHLFVGWSGHLFALYFIISIFFVIGVIGLCVVIRDLRTNQTNLALRITRFVFEVLMFVFGVFLIVALSVLGFGILNDSSVWSGAWLIVLIVASFVNLWLRSRLLHEETKSHTTFLSGHEK